MEHERVFIVSECNLAFWTAMEETSRSREVGVEWIGMKHHLRTFWIYLTVLAFLLVAALPHMSFAGSHPEEAGAFHHSDPALDDVEPRAGCEFAASKYDEGGGCGATAAHCFPLIGATYEQSERHWTLISLAFSEEPAGSYQARQTSETPPPRA